jgi:hypothetical protein
MITARVGGFYRCNQCKEDFAVRTGTIFEKSHVPLHKWVYAMYLLVTARKGISSMQLAKEIGVTQKSAWFVLHRLREACGGSDLKKLTGIIEIDETFVGGKEANKQASNNRPGSNATGVNFRSEELWSKRLNLLVELVPPGYQSRLSFRSFKHSGVRGHEGQHRCCRTCTGAREIILAQVHNLDFEAAFVSFVERQVADRYRRYFRIFS